MFNSVTSLSGKILIKIHSDADFMGISLEEPQMKLYCNFFINKYYCYNVIC